MRYKVAAAAAVLACALVGTAQDAPAKRYVSKEGGFSVAFPAGADVKTKNLDAPGGLKMTMVGSEADKKAFMVMFMEFPAGTLKAVPADAILDGAAKGAVAKSGGTEVSNKKITFGKDKLPGREVVIDKDGKLALTRIIIADPKMYILVVAGEKDVVEGKAGAAFLKSFEIEPGAKKKAVEKD